MIWLLLLACAPEAREHLDLPVSAAGLPADTVSLTRAEVVLSDLRLEEPGSTGRLRLPSLVPVAHAHPGHDMSGDTVGELLGTWTVDLLGEPVELGVASALEGELATGRLLLRSVHLEGSTAEEVAFSFLVEAEEEITGIPVSGFLTADDPPEGLALDISPDQILAWADLETPDEDGDGLLTLEDGLLGNTVTFGAVSTASYTLTLLE